MGPDKDKQATMWAEILQSRTDTVLSWEKQLALLPRTQKQKRGRVIEQLASARDQQWEAIVESYEREVPLDTILHLTRDTHKYEGLIWMLAEKDEPKPWER